MSCSAANQVEDISEMQIAFHTSDDSVVIENGEFSVKRAWWAAGSFWQ
jgi:hypothetical protein